MWRKQRRSLFIPDALRGRRGSLQGEAFRDGCPARQSAESRAPWCSAKQTPSGRRHGRRVRKAAPFGFHLHPLCAVHRGGAISWPTGLLRKPSPPRRVPWPDGINHSSFLQSKLTVKMNNTGADWLIHRGPRLSSGLVRGSRGELVSQTKPERTAVRSSPMSVGIGKGSWLPLPAVRAGQKGLKGFAFQKVDPRIAI